MYAPPREACVPLGQHVSIVLFSSNNKVTLYCKPLWSGLNQLLLAEECPDCLVYTVCFSMCAATPSGLNVFNKVVFASHIAYWFSVDALAF